MNSKTTSVVIKHLADCSEFVPVCAAWAFGEWGCHIPDGSLERGLQRFQACAQKESIPFTLMAIVDHKPAGMISLWVNDLESRPDLTPWIAAVYVHSHYRNQGIAKKLLMHMEQEAIRHDVKTIYLHTETAQALYEKIGYKPMEIVETDFGPSMMMKKDLA